MDDGQLKKILNDAPVPPVDENAQKIAVNLALAEFAVAQVDERNNISQGSSLWGRLTGRSHMKRRDPMNKKIVYGGMATAMVAVLAVGVTFQQGLMGTTSMTPQASINQMQFIEFDRSQTAGAGARVESDQLAAAMQPAPAFRGDLSSDLKENSPGRQVMAEAETQSASRALPETLPVQEMADAAMNRAAPVAPAMKMAMTEEKRKAEGVIGSSVAPYVVPPEPVPQDLHKDVGRDKFEDFEENPIKLVAQEPVSTFSIDVDTSSYAFLRKQINAGVLPQKDAVRVEEMINYFDYDYALPDDKAQPFKPSVTVLNSPWHEGRKLVHIGIKGYDIPKTESPRSNLVFLLDTSGSMNEPDKLPLLVSSLKLLLDSLKPDDTVAIVTYAGSAGTVLEPTKAAEKAKIIAALENLNAGGSTAGAEGIRQAYTLAEAGFDKEAVNRVILATDGDFNVGITNPEELQDFVERKRESGIFLSVFGFGQGNYNDQMMQTLAQNGNGVAAYIDTLNEARKVLVEEASSTLFPIAKDVKIQVEFNPATVAEYRLVGYETRKLNREDFNNDKVDAGDIGAGHTVTAIYEITPVGGPLAVDGSRYAAKSDVAVKPESGEYGFLKLRYKLPDQDTSKLIETPIMAQETAQTYCGPAQDCEPSAPYASDDVRFSIAVASFGQMLKGSKYTGKMSYDDMIAMAQDAKASDEFGYRAEFINLVRLAKTAAALPANRP